MCKHENMECNVEIATIEDVGRTMADVKITCLDCKTPFKFLGLPVGVNFDKPMVSFDGLEGRFPIAPKDEV